MANIKWSKVAIEAYKASGTTVRAIGGHALRDLHDKDAQAVLTFWATPKGLVVTQVFLETGDVVYMKDTTPDALDADTIPPIDPKHLDAVIAGTVPAIVSQGSKVKGWDSITA